MSILAAKDRNGVLQEAIDGVKELTTIQTIPPLGSMVQVSAVIGMLEELQEKGK